MPPPISTSTWEKMTPRRARAWPDHRGWTIDTSSSGLPSALGCPQRQGSREIPEQEGQEPETRAFWKLVCLPLPSFEAPSSLVARHLRVWGAGFCWVHWGPWSEAELWGLGSWEGPAFCHQMALAASPKDIGGSLWFPLVAWGT